jgi:site-specific DNA-methyltransferase (adenine-specific)
MRNHENILIFCNGTLSYYPQIQEKPKENIRPVLPRKNSYVYGKFNNNAPRLIDVNKTYPKSVLTFANPNHGEAGLHPTQKPTALFSYLIRTYTQEGQIVLDPFCGSGTTAVSCIQTNRRFICGDFTSEYVELARKRVATCDPYQDTPIDDNHTQLSLFGGE